MMLEQDYTDAICLRCGHPRILALSPTCMVCGASRVRFFYCTHDWKGLGVIDPDQPDAPSVVVCIRHGCGASK